MNFLKRAVLAVSRRKGKSLIILVLFFAIATMVLAGLAIEHATDYASVLARQKLGAQLTLSYNRSAAMQKAREGGEERPAIQTEPVTEAMAETIASQNNIVDFNYIVNANGTADGFTAVVTGSETQTDSSTNDFGPMQGGFGSDADFVLPDVSVTGVSSSALADTFSNGAELISGRHINSQDANQKVAIVEKNLAEQNSLTVGSKIKIKATRSDTIVEYKIVGIYEATAASTSQVSGMRNLSFTDPYNQIFVDYQSAIPLKSSSSDITSTLSNILSAASC